MDGWIGRSRRAILLACGLTIAGLGWIALPPSVPTVSFPEGKTFALSIIDDTDMATLDRLRPVYDVLERYGFRTTKTVWVLPQNGSQHDADQGESLNDPDYREFIVDLQRKGFEIALHGVRGGSSRREDTLAGLEAFRSILGHDPRMQVNHSLNQENLYWGRHLYALAPLRWAAGLAISYDFSGHDPQSPYFWGDVARERIQYVRRFTYGEINLLAVNPAMPYRLDEMPYVNYWFPTADGDRVINFVKLLSDENLDRLEREGGVCLIYAHLGAGSFNRNGGVDPRFEERVRAVAARNGWFVPASEILDHLRNQPSWTGRLGLRDVIRLDVKFVLERVGF
jgi:hypothetical protein